MLKRVGCGNQWEATYLFIRGKTATLVPEFVEEDQPSAELRPWYPDDDRFVQKQHFYNIVINRMRTSLPAFISYLRLDSVVGLYA